MRGVRRGHGFTRRDTLKLSGLAFGGLALGGAQLESNAPQGRGKGLCEVGRCYPTSYKTDAYTYGRQLPPFDPLTPVEPDEMRITFMGSSIPPVTRSQEMMSIFVQVGSGGGTANQPDQVIFDCGSGVCANYSALQIGWSQMNKIFISHLHGDHMSDLTFIYQSGPQSGRKAPLFVFGPGPSDFIWTDPDGNQPYGLFDDGTKTFCEMFRAMLRWQSEGFCFQSTGVNDWKTQQQVMEDWGLPVYPEPVRDPRAPWVGRYNELDYLDSFNDGYAVVPIELQYDLKGGTAYRNKSTGLKVTHFPVVHTRRGAIGFKLEWEGPQGPLSMIYTSDTKPEKNCIEQARNWNDGENRYRGVDVFIHEMVPPPDVWAMKMAGLSAPGAGMDPAEWNRVCNWTKIVQESSHTPQGAFGYILSQIAPRPRLTVPTHFVATDDTVACALESVQAKVADIGRLGEQITWSFDLMVLRVFKDRILQHRAAVSDYALVQSSEKVENQADPKYWKWADAARTQKTANPTAQIDDTDAIPPGPDTYDESGY